MKRDKRRKLQIGKKRFSLESQFFEALRYVKESRNYIYLVIGIFLLSALIAFVYPSNFSFFDNLLRDLLDKTMGLSGFSLISYIFTNNVLSAFLGLFFGIFLGLFSFINGMINGAVLGYVFAKIYAINGINDFWRILPHGVFELPAIFIALGLGVKLGFFIFSRNMKEEFFRRFYNSFLTFLLIIVPLLVLAAIIEGLLITLLG
ncbi:MAG: stage II sporulation protein M [Nanoarchaeota archaeon]